MTTSPNADPAFLDGLARRTRLDAADPLAAFARPLRAEPRASSPTSTATRSGRPLTATGERFADFVAHDWGTRLIRSWDERGWTCRRARRPHRLADPRRRRRSDRRRRLDDRAALQGDPRGSRRSDSAQGRDEIVHRRRPVPDRPIRRRGHRRASAALTVRWIDVDTASA